MQCMVDYVLQIYLSLSSSRDIHEDSQEIIFCFSFSSNYVISPLRGLRVTSQKGVHYF